MGKIKGRENKRNRHKEIIRGGLKENRDTKETRGGEERERGEK